MVFSSSGAGRVWLSRQTSAHSEVARISFFTARISSSSSHLRPVTFSTKAIDSCSWLVT